LKLKLYIPWTKNLKKNFRKYIPPSTRRKEGGEAILRCGVPRKSKPQANNFPKKKCLHLSHGKVFRARSARFPYFLYTSKLASSKKALSEGVKHGTMRFDVMYERTDTCEWVKADLDKNAVRYTENDYL